MDAISAETEYLTTSLCQSRAWRPPLPVLQHVSCKTKDRVVDGPFNSRDKEEHIIPAR